MKKILLIAVLLIGLIAAKAQDHYYHATEFNIKPTNSTTWVGWKASDVNMVINFGTRHIEIYSQTPQVIDYTSMTETKYPTFSLYKGSATDRYYQLMNIYYQIFKDGRFFLTIEYNDYTYSYNLVEADPD